MSFSALEGLRWRSPVTSVPGDICSPLWNGTFTIEALPSKPGADVAQAFAGLAGSDDLPQDGELGVVEQQKAAFGARGRHDQAVAQVIIEVGARQAGRR